MARIAFNTVNCFEKVESIFYSYQVTNFTRFKTVTEFYKMFPTFPSGHKETSFPNKNTTPKKNTKTCHNPTMRTNHEINICNLNWVKSNQYITHVSAINQEKKSVMSLLGN